MTAAMVTLAWTYLVAAIPFGVIVATLYGGDQDVRTAGSGNIGATNVARIYGWRLGGGVMALDLLKGLLPVLWTRLLWPEASLLWPTLVALVAFVGHCWPVYLEFRGGKGVATGAGGLLGLTPIPALLAFGVWGLALGLTGRSSVASLLATLSMVGFVLWLDPGATPAAVLVGAGIAFTHVPNLRRLMHGEEDAVVRTVKFSRGPTRNPGEAALEEGPGGAPTTRPLWGRSERGLIRAGDDGVESDTAIEE